MIESKGVIWMSIMRMMERLDYRSGCELVENQKVGQDEEETGYAGQCFYQHI